MAGTKMVVGLGGTTTVGDLMPRCAMSPGSIIAFTNNELSLGPKKEGGTGTC